MGIISTQDADAAGTDQRVTPEQKAKLLEVYLSDWERASRLLKHWLPAGSEWVDALTRAQTAMTRLRSRNNVRKRVG